MDTEQLKNNACMGPIAIWCITPNGFRLGQKIQEVMNNPVLFVSKKIGVTGKFRRNAIVFETLITEIHEQFHQFSGHVFIFSTGIAVRAIAHIINSKLTDPAVVVIDDGAKHAISLLSGHIGGANHLAETIAAHIGATPVITTATDINNLPAIDMIAMKKDLYMETPQNIKHINMAFLTEDPIRLYDPQCIVKKSLPDRLWAEANWETAQLFCSYETKKVSRETMVLRPPVLSVGIGCNRGTSHENIKEFLIFVLEKEGLSINSIYQLATSDVKRDEIGLLSLAKEMQLPMEFYGNQDLTSVKDIKTPSKVVEKYLGVKSVCEAAAILSAGMGKLIVEKKKNKDVTIAVAIKK